MKGANYWIDFARYPTVLVSLIIVVCAAILALLAPYLGLPDPEKMGTKLSELYVRPGAEHWMGTDNFGRDMLSRVIWGTRLAFLVAIVASLVSTLLGVVLGSIAGYFGGLVDHILARTFDVFLLIPAFFLVILIVALFGSNIYLIILAIAVTSWSGQARIMRSQVLTLKSRTYVQASLGMGSSNLRVLFRHIVPNGLAPLITNGTILMGLAILTEAGLSFLGLGDQSTISWGRMIFEGQSQLRVAAWLVIFPGLAMLLLVAALNLLGDGLNQILDPNLRVRGEPDKAPVPEGLLGQGVAEDGLASSRTGRDGEGLLEVRDLTMFYHLSDNWVRAVDGVSFSLESGGGLGIVGESGCGKSSLGLALMQVLPRNAKILGGSVRFDGVEVLNAGDHSFRSVRWKRMSTIFQSAMNALNPVLKVRQQLAETYRLHRPAASRAEVQERIEEIFDTIGIPRWRMESYPHELSGGMRQRVMIALSLLLNPDVIIADEPTTALDVLVQDQILSEIDKLRSRMNLSLILISHDMGTVAETCERIAVMYAGQLVEEAPTAAIFSDPRHPYTQALVSAVPRLTGPKHELTSLPGEPFVPIGDIKGCRFAPRCSFATDLCREQEPPRQRVDAGHFSACHFALDERIEIRAGGGLLS